MCLKCCVTHGRHAAVLSADIPSAGLFLPALSDWPFCSFPNLFRIPRRSAQTVPSGLRNPTQPETTGTRRTRLKAASCFASCVYSFIYQSAQNAGLTGRRVFAKPVPAFGRSCKERSMTFGVVRSGASVEPVHDDLSTVRESVGESLFSVFQPAAGPVGFRPFAEKSRGISVAVWPGHVSPGRAGRPAPLRGLNRFQTGCRRTNRLRRAPARLIFCRGPCWWRRFPKAPFSEEAETREIRSCVPARNCSATRQWWNADRVSIR